MPKLKGNRKGCITKCTNQDGTVVYRWSIMFNYRRWSGTCSTEVEAQQEIEKIKAQQLPFETVCKDWYKTQEQRMNEGIISKNTYLGYKYTLMHIINKWGNLPIRSISADIIEKGIVEIKKPVYSNNEKGKRKTDNQEELGADRYINYDFGMYKKIEYMLGQIFRYAEKKGIVKKNPMNLVKNYVILKKLRKKGNFPIRDI